MPRTFPRLGLLGCIGVLTLGGLVLVVEYDEFDRTDAVVRDGVCGWLEQCRPVAALIQPERTWLEEVAGWARTDMRSEEHTSELQSQ